MDGGKYTNAKYWYKYIPNYQLIPSRPTAMLSRSRLYYCVRFRTMPVHIIQQRDILWAGMQGYLSTSKHREGLIYLSIVAQLYTLLLAAAAEVHVCPRCMTRLSAGTNR